MQFYHIFYFLFRRVTFPENTVYYSKRTNGKAEYMNEVLDNAKDLEHLHELESRIRQGFRQFLAVGNALAEIRMNRLYKLEDFKSFAEYVKAKFNYNLAYCNYVINTPIGVWPLFLYCFLLAVPGDIALSILGAIVAKRVRPVIGLQTLYTAKTTAKL